MVGAAELARYVVAVGVDPGTDPLFARGKREHLEPLNPVVLIELILGGLGEANFVESMQLMHNDALGFFERPIAATIGINIVKACRAAAPVAEE